MIEKELAAFRKGFKKAKSIPVLEWMQDEYIHPFVSGINTGWGISPEVRSASYSNEIQGWQWQEWQEKFSGHPTPVFGADGDVFLP